MIKKQIYPKTERIGTEKIVITEKLDGSNLVIFKLNDKIYYAQRNNILTIDEIEENKQMLYKGLYQFIKDYDSNLLENMVEGSAVCGEYIGMGQIKYPHLDKRFYMFAKANISEDFNLYNIKYNHDLFGYPFTNTKKVEEGKTYSAIDFIPEFIGIVPKVDTIDFLPTQEYLDKLYLDDCLRESRNIEGYVVEFNGKTTKYVRMKNGKLKEHFVWEEK